MSFVSDSQPIPLQNTAPDLIVNLCPVLLHQGNWLSFLVVMELILLMENNVGLLWRLNFLSQSASFVGLMMSLTIFAYLRNPLNVIQSKNTDAETQNLHFQTENCYIFSMFFQLFLICCQEFSYQLHHFHIQMLFNANDNYVHSYATIPSHL